MENEAVKNLRAYLRIKTVQPNPDYESCGKFLHRLSDEVGLQWRTYECVVGKPFFIMTLLGSNPLLPSVLLYSHTDVVPVEEKCWTYDPFAGYKDDKGRIYGRGSQDMKSVGIQYVEAIRKLKMKGIKNFLRTVHIVWGPDEEIGSVDGMAKFVNDPVFKELNVGFGLDEGIASEDHSFKVYYAQRSSWWLVVNCTGQPGHGSIMSEDTAAEKFLKLISLLLQFREKQKETLKNDPSVKPGNITSLNLTKVEGGSQVNVLPSEMKAYFDIRVPPTADFKQLEEYIKECCTSAGSNVTYNFLYQEKMNDMTPIDRKDPWWNAFSSVFEQGNYNISTEIFGGGTDGRFLRQNGIRALGFSPINFTPVLLHDHDEYIDEKIFLEGVDIYEKLISKLANLDESAEHTSIMH